MLIQSFVNSQCYSFLGEASKIILEERAAPFNRKISYFSSTSNILCQRLWLYILLFLFHQLIHFIALGGFFFCRLNRKRDMGTELFVGTKNTKSLICVFFCTFANLNILRRTDHNSELCTFWVPFPTRRSTHWKKKENNSSKGIYLFSHVFDEETAIKILWGNQLFIHAFSYNQHRPVWVPGWGR